MTDTTTDPIRTAARAVIVEAPSTEDPDVGASLLVVEYEDAAGPWYLLPGGGQDHEESLEACLRREVREELGIEIAVGPLLHVREFMSSRLPSSHLGPGFHQVEMLFEARIVGSVRPHLPPTADRLQRGFRWLALDALDAVRFYPQRLSRALLASAASPCYMGVDP